MQRRRRPGPARHGPAGMARAGHGMATAAHDNIAPVTHAAIHRRPSPKATLRCAALFGFRRGSGWLRGGAI
jgi:hypothetical protein